MEPTSVDISDYVEMRVRTAIVSEVAATWTEAWNQFRSGNPDELIKLLLEELDLYSLVVLKSEEEDSSCGISVGPQHHRFQANEEARNIQAMLDQIAEVYGVERVWGHLLDQHRTETTRRDRIESEIKAALTFHSLEHNMLIVSPGALLKRLADTVQNLMVGDAATRLEQAKTALDEALAAASITQDDRPK